MAIVVSYNALLFVNGVDLSNHCVGLTVNDGQESRDVTAMGDTSRRFRAGLGTSSIEATFWSDTASGSVNQTLTPLITLASTGFIVYARKDNSARNVNNPEYYMTAIIDGDVNVLDEKPGEVSQLKVKFMPYSSFNIYTSSS
jgi:hypothetical protein